MEDQKVKELAQTLKNSSLAASDYEAMEKAKAILGTKIQKETVEQKKPEMLKIEEEFYGKKEKTEPKKESFLSHLTEKFNHEKKPELDKHRFSQPGYDIFSEELTVNDLMREVGVNPEEITEEKSEDMEKQISNIEEEIIREEKNLKK